MELGEQNEKMEGLVNFLEDEKIRLQDKMEKMTAAGKQQRLFLYQRYVTDITVLLTCCCFPDKDLVLELETMRAKHGVCGRERSPSRLDAFVKSLEEERDYYRQEAERYKSARGPGGLDLSPSRSPGRGRSPWSKVTRVRDKNQQIKTCLLFSLTHFSAS